MDVFRGPIGAPKKWASKNGSAEVDAKELSWRWCKVFIFPTHFEDFVLLRPLLAHHFFGRGFENQQKCIGFITVLDALTEAMLDHPKGCPKSKNEHRAAWERSGKKQNERHAAWERLRSFYGPDGSPRMGQTKTSQTVYFKRF